MTPHLLVTIATKDALQKHISFPLSAYQKRRAPWDPLLLPEKKILSPESEGNRFIYLFSSIIPGLKVTSTCVLPHILSALLPREKLAPDHMYILVMYLSHSAVCCCCAQPFCRTCDPHFTSSHMLKAPSLPAEARHKPSTSACGHQRWLERGFQSMFSPYCYPLNLATETQKSEITFSWMKISGR